MARADVVLLRNGAVLEGSVEVGPDRVLVHGPGSEITVPRAEVAFVGVSLRDAYAWRRAQLPAGVAGLDARLDLAGWAIDQRLWPEASRELLEARRLRPDSRRLGWLEEQLRRSALAKSPPASTPPVRETSPDPRDAPEEPVASDREPSAAGPALVIPPEELTRFTRRVQPILVNSCTAGGCHQLGPSDPMPLDRSLLHGYADARSTERNLHATLATIDLENPGESPLLLAARGPHAGVTPIVGPRRGELLERIESWVNAIAAANAKPDSADAELVALLDAPATAAGDDSLRVEEPTAPAEEPVVSAAAAAPGWRRVEPRDEFDAEEFNRRYRRPIDDTPVE